MRIFISFFIFIFLNINIYAQEVVNIYTSRHYESDIKIYKKFEEKTGIKVNYVSGKGKALFERIKSEGKNCPADIFITVDAGNLWKVENEGFFRKINSKKIIKSIDSQYIGPSNKWIGITKRFRIIVYNPNVFDYEEIKNINYEDLSKDEYKDKIAIRSSSNIYNQSLIASMIHHNGRKVMSEWLDNFVSNFARKPQGNDRAQVMAVAYGEADLAVVNSYYLGIMISGKGGPKQKEAANRIKVVFPNQTNRGVHVNISGAGILKNSKNYDNAIKYLEFLLEPEIQKHIVYNTFEYPIIKNLDPSPVIKNLVEKYKEDNLKVRILGELNPRAVRLMDKSGWK
tara:strand:+ start:186125 stop:187147 length:1023 start_codon:yes stop_codon:yes gene_type:complete